MRVAIIGSGPSAFYTCQGLINTIEKISIDILEKLPVPFGLVRYGVAPDHQKTKNIIRLFSKVLDNEKVNFYGNISVGKDVDIDFLSENYDAVIIASGADCDKKLFINGAEKKGVYGSSEFVGWYNGIPKYKQLNPDLNVSNAIIIGNGNVALDCARLLAKQNSEFYNSDITNYSFKKLNNSAIKKIFILGRRGPLESKFTIAELRELGNLNGFSPEVDYPLDSLKNMLLLPDLDTRTKKNLQLLIEYKNSKKQTNKKIIFKFLYSPTEILGETKAKSIKLVKNIIEDNQLKPTDNYEEIDAGIIISAIGYETNQIANLTLDKSKSYFQNEDGHIKKNIYVTGWAANTSVGVIGSNKTPANIIANKISKSVRPNQKLPDDALKIYLKNNNKRFISKKDWVRIDKKEIENADKNFIRDKFVDLDSIASFLNS